jgi:hypothetical protein
VARVISEDVPERVAGLGRRAEDVRVVAALEHGAAAAHHPVQSARDRDREAPHAIPERSGPAGLDDRVEVIPLDGVLHDGEVGSSSRRRKRVVNDAEGTLAAEVPDMGQDAQRDVHGQAARELRPAHVRSPALPAAGFLPALGRAPPQVRRVNDSCASGAAMHQSLHATLTIHRATRAQFSLADAWRV